MMLASTFDPPTWEAIGTCFMASVVAWRLLDAWLNRRIINQMRKTTADQTKEIKQHINNKMAEYSNEHTRALKVIDDKFVSVNSRLDRGDLRMDRIEAAIKANGNGHG